MIGFARAGSVVFWKWRPSASTAQPGARSGDVPALCATSALVAGARRSSRSSPARS